MSLKKVHGEQPKEFEFSAENIKNDDRVIEAYLGN